MLKVSAIILTILVMTTGINVGMTAAVIPQNYQQELSCLDQQKYKFDGNQIRSFVYYWYGLHDKHVNVSKSLELLDLSNLTMIFPEQTVKDAAGYELWYSNVGKNIKNNIHTVKYLNIVFIDNHKYRLDVIVNWRAVDVTGNFIDVDATQEWLLVDGDSDDHPYVREYKVLNFKNNINPS